MPLFEQEEYAEGEKHIKLLWSMATIGIKLGFHNDVIECLEEVRRLTPEELRQQNKSGGIHRRGRIIRSHFRLLKQINVTLQHSS